MRCAALFRGVVCGLSRLLALSHDHEETLDGIGAAVAELLADRVKSREVDEAAKSNVQLLEVLVVDEVEQRCVNIDCLV